MAAIINGITCQEVIRDYKEGADWDRGPVADKGYLCDWGDRLTVASGLLGLASATTIGGTITLDLPAAHPEIAGIYCRSISIEGKGRPSQGSVQLQFEKAIVWAHYGCITWTFQGFDFAQIDPSNPMIFAKQNISISAETKTIPAQQAWWKTANTATGTEYGFPVPIVEMEITLMHFPWLPAQQVIAAVANPLNNDTFLGCAAGTVFFMGMKSEATHDSAGTFDQNITYVFKYRPIAPWDQDWNGSAWDQVLTESGGDAFLGRSDLTQLFPSAYSA